MTRTCVAGGTGQVGREVVRQALLLGAAFEEPSQELHRLRTMGGPEVNGMAELAETWKHHSGSRGRLVRLSLPGAAGKYLREGGNLVPEHPYGSETFGGWLAKRADSL